MARPQPQPSLAKAPTKEHPLTPEAATPPAPVKVPSKRPSKATPADDSVMFSTRLSSDLRRRLKVHAAERGQTIQEVTEAALQAYLQGVGKR